MDLHTTRAIRDSVAELLKLNPPPRIESELQRIERNLSDEIGRMTAAEIIQEVQDAVRRRHGLTNPDSPDGQVVIW